jgi:hypothetical protein
MAIDPKACVGDPCFDAVDYVTGGAGLAAPAGVHPVNVLSLLVRGDTSAAAELLAISR